MRRLIFCSGALVLAVLLLAGCGGGDDDETTAAPATTTSETPSALSKEELIAQGDAICAEVNAAVGTLASTEAADSATQTADLYSGMVERLKDLGTPSDDSAGYPEFMDAAEALAQAERDVGLAAERGEAEALAAAEGDASSALTSFQAAAGDYGFEQCGEGPSAPVPGSAGVPSGSESEAEPAEEAEEAEEAPEEVEAAPEPESGGAGVEAGGGAEAGGGTAGGGSEGSGGGGSSGGIGPG